VRLHLIDSLSPSLPLRREGIAEEVELKKKHDERRKGLRDTLKKSKSLLQSHKKETSSTELTPK
jgi:DNA polymerase II large subunit